MEEIINSLNPMLEKLSETFCVSVDFIRANLYVFLAKYGLYELIGACVGRLILFGLLFSVIGIVAGSFISYLYYEEFRCEKEYDNKDVFRMTVKIFIPVSIIPTAIIVIYPIIQYLVSPELYGALRLIEAIK